MPRGGDTASVSVLTAPLAAPGRQRRLRHVSPPKFLPARVSGANIEGPEESRPLTGPTGAVISKTQKCQAFFFLRWLPCRDSPSPRWPANRPKTREGCTRAAPRNTEAAAGHGSANRQGGGSATVFAGGCRRLLQDAQSSKELEFDERVSGRHARILDEQSRE